MKASPKYQHRELHHTDRHRIADAKLHQGILDGGDDAAARAVGDAVAKDLGLTDAEIEALHAQKPKGASSGGNGDGSGGGNPLPVKPSSWAAIREESARLLQLRGFDPGHKPASESDFGKSNNSEALRVRSVNLAEAVMPIKPGKDEKQDDWMHRCVPEMMGQNGGTKRPQEQAVAACLTMWRDAHPGAAPPPDNKSISRADGDDDGKKPYGDVEYADPGYQKDGKKRYHPIDTVDHIKAAWSYINKPENQEPYTADQVSKIKARIVAAWKDKIDAKGPPGADEKTFIKQAQIDPPDPDVDDYDDWMDDCVSQMLDSDDDMDEDTATDRCSLMWEEASIPGQPGGLHAFEGNRVRHKTHSEDVNGMEFILSDETPDRLGDVISSEGWQLDAFRNNPVALFNHNSDFPIGRWHNLHVDSKAKALRGHLQLAPAGTSARIDEIRKLVEAGILRAVSVGFRVLKSQPLRPEEGQRFAGEHYTRQELVETSLVSVPANPNALAVAKTLKISSATLDLVFAKPGSNRDESARRRRFHRQARRDTSHIEGRAMNGNSPLGQRITASQQRLVRLQDQLTEHLKNVNDENVSDADMVTTQELNAKIGQADNALHTLIEAEKRLAVTSIGPEDAEARAALTNGGGGSTAVAVHHARPFAIPAKKVEPIDYMWRTLTLQIKHHTEGRKRPILEIVQETYGNDEPTRWVNDIITRNPSAPANITTPTWALELVSQVWTGFVQALIPFSIYPEIASRGQQFTFDRNGVINLPLRQSVPQISGAFVGEGAPIPVRQGAFATAQLTPKKMAVISTFTRELADHSTPAIEGIIRESIQLDTGIALDAVLMDANPATAVRPAGLLNGVTPLTPTAGGTILALIGDINQLIGALSVATLGNIRNPVWLASPSTKYAIALTPTAVEGQLPFREEVSRGMLMSIPIVASATVPASTLMLMDCADYASVTEAAPRFDVSDQAVLHMEDTAPLAIIGGTTGTPVPAVPTRSLWQTDTIGVRMILPMNWLMRRTGMVQYVTGYTW